MRMSIFRIRVALEGRTDALIAQAGGEAREPRRGSIPDMPPEELAKRVDAVLTGHMKKKGMQKKVK